MTKYVIELEIDTESCLSIEQIVGEAFDDYSENYETRVLATIKQRLS